MPVATRRDFLRALSGALPSVLLAKAWLACGGGSEQAPALETTSFAGLDASRSFDVCVVGTGPAGALLAGQLARDGVNTLLLESGVRPGATDPRLAELDAYTTSGRAYALRESRFRGVGGTSNLWTGGCIRLYPEDLADDNSYLPPGAAWPFDYAELEPFYERAEAELGVRGADWTSLGPPRRVPYPQPLEPDPGTSRLRGALASAGVSPDPIPHSDLDGQPLRTATTHLPAFSQSRSGTLAIGATVTRIVAGPSGAVSHLLVHGLDGAPREVRARFYVVACGVVETCRLLLLSRPGFSVGVGVGSDRVGRRFMTHYRGPTATARIPAGSPIPRKGSLRSLIARQFVAEARKQGLGAVRLRFAQRRQHLMILSDLEVEPTPANRITLDPDRLDRFGNPGAHLHLEMSERDRATATWAEARVREVAARLELADVQLTPEPVQLSHHHMGGCPTGRDPATSVVDADLRVHGTANLYVAGGAPFVTCGVAHPTLTISALSLRLADHLAGRVRAVSRRESAAYSAG